MTQVTTTQSVDGWSILEYKGIVTAKVVAGTGVFSDITASFSDFFGGRSEAYQRQLTSLEDEALNLIREKAARLGGNWVVGIRFDFDEISGKGKQMFMVSAQGTAVVAARPSEASDEKLSGGFVSCVELTDAMQRSALRQKLERNADTLLIDDNLWSEVTRLQVPEGILFALKRLGAMEYGADQRVSELLRALPVQVAKRTLYGILESEAGFDRHIVRWLVKLSWADLGWIERSLSDSDIEARRKALLVLEAKAPSYSREDVDRLVGISDMIRTAFPDAASIEVEKKGLFSRSKEASWRCGCGEVVRVEMAMCPSCSRTRDGLRYGDPKPSEMALRIGDQVAHLREIFGEGPSES